MIWLVLVFFFIVSRIISLCGVMFVLVCLVVFSFECLVNDVALSETYTETDK